MYKTILAFSALISSVALLIFAMGNSFAYPQGPNISLGSNPIVSFSCNSTAYVVPANNDYVITDFIGVYSGPYIYLDGVNTMYLSQSGNFGLTTGWKVPSGTAITCNGGNVYLSGYLVQQ